MTAATMVVVAVAFRVSGQPHQDAGTSPLLALERPTRTPAKVVPPRRSRPGGRPAASPRPSQSPSPRPSQTARPRRSLVVAGGVEGTPYGPVQVEITLRGGRIIKARTLVHPSGGGETDQINS